MEEVLKDLYDRAQTKGYKKSIEDFTSTLYTNDNVLNDMYGYVQSKGYNKSINDFEILIGKKKDEEEVITESESETGSLESPEYESVLPSVIAEQEKDTALERTLGKNFITDFFGDIYRAAEQGQVQGAAVDDALEVMDILGSGKNVTQEDIQTFIAANNELANTPESDEMRKFNQDFDAAGGGMFGFVKALFQNRGQIIPQLFVSSVSAMLNPASLKAAGGAIVTGTGAGALAGAPAGGIGAIPGAVGGFISSLPFALGAAGGTLETALSFGEFLQEEIEKNGKEFTEEAVMEVLNDQEAYGRIKNRAAGRGLTIGAIDALTAGIAGKAVKSLKSAAKKAGKFSRTKQFAKEAIAAGGIEGIGGSTGEAVARGVVGQEMDIKEIGFEGIAGTATVPGSFAYGQLIAKPQYSMNKGLVKRADIENAINNADDKDFAKTKFQIKNDPILRELVEDRKKALKVRDEVIREGETARSSLSPEAQEKVIELEIEKKNLEGKRDKGSQLRFEEIDKELEGLYQLKPEEVIKETETIESEIEPALTQEDLLENETIEEGEQIENKGKVSTQIAQVTEKDGVTTTKFIFNRSDKDKSQRGKSKVSEKALEKRGYQIDQDSRDTFEDDLADGVTVSYEVKEIRESETGASADVTVTYTRPDGTQDSITGSATLEPFVETEQVATETEVIANKNRDPEVNTVEAVEGAVRGEEVSVAVDNNMVEIINETKSENIIEQRDKIYKNISKPLNTSESRKKAFLDLVDTLSKDSDVDKTTIGRIKATIQKSTYDSPDKVRNTLDGIVTTFDTQERKDLYKKVDKITPTIKKQIRRARKRGVSPEVTLAAEQFLDINPLDVTDLKEYVKKAEQITEGLKPTKITTKDSNIASPFVVEDVNKYTLRELKQVEIRNAKIKSEAFQELTGVSADELSMNEVNEVLRNAYNEGVSNPDAFIISEISKITGKEQIINTAAENAFKTYKTIVESQIETGKDSFNAKNEVKLSPREKKIIQDFMEIDINDLSIPEKIKVIDAIVNFATNQGTGGMVATISKYRGSQMAAMDNQNDLRSSELKNIVDTLLPTSTGLYWSTNIASLPIMSEFMFGNQTDSNTFFKNSGLQEVINGSANGERIATAIGDIYHAKFFESNPNDQDFYSPENVTERGMYAFVNRTIVGTESQQQEEFGRRKGLVEEAMVELKYGSKLERQKGEDYAKVYNRILKDATKIEDVKSKVDNSNIDAVDYIINEWSEFYPDLKNHAEGIYNIILENDPNYVGDTYSLLEKSADSNFDDPVFVDDTYFNKRKIHDKKTGVLEPNQRLYTLKKGDKKRYVNLDFDSQQIFKMRKALIDINTAEGIQQLKGYTDSDSFKDIIEDGDVREAFLNRIKEYVNSKRGNKFISEKSRKDARILNRFVTLGVSRTLGSVGQYPKQLVPLSNTAVNAGGQNTFNAVKEFTSNKDLREWIKSLPFDIANRGIEASALIDSYDSKFQKQARSKSGKMVAEVEKLQNWWLKQMLINPDKIAANASWVAYYGRQMKRKGINVFEEGFDWANHEVDQEAGNYAQQQVDRQQNTSQKDLQGAWFRSDNTTTRLATKIFLPFSNFLLNQKSRMYSDLNTMTNKNSNTPDRVKAARSLGGLVVESAVFNAIGLGLTMGTAALSNMLGAPEEDPEKLEQQTANRIKGRAGNIVSDILSPLPPLDDGVRIGLNALIASISDDENPFEFYTSNETLLEDLGLGSIVFEKSLEQPFVAIKSMLSGTYNGKELDKEHLELAQITAAMWPLYISGALPAEVGSIITYNLKRIKDSVR